MVCARLRKELIDLRCRYWDVEVKPDEYSYVNAALNHGYSILTYDRLGTGNSTKADAYDIVQAGVEIEIVRGVTELARAGKLVSSSNVVQSTCNDTGALVNYVPSKVVHIGHSYGSFMTSGLLARYGNLSDGAILSEYSERAHYPDMVNIEMMANTICCICFNHFYFLFLKHFNGCRASEIASSRLFPLVFLTIRGTVHLERYTIC